MRALPLLLASLTVAPALAWAEPAALRQVDVVEKLHEPLPLGLTFTDSEGKPFQLARAFDVSRHDGKPVVLTLVYYQCQALCDLVLSGLVRGLTETGLSLGKDYRLVTASINPTETPDLAQRRKRGYLQALGQRDRSPDWTFLTGKDDAIRALAESVGFQYSYDERTRQFAHAATIFVITPEGRISRYLYGIDFKARDLKLALLEAADGRVGTTLDRIVLKCFKYDPADRRYTLYMFGFLRGGALLVFFALSTLLWKLWRREFRAAGGTAV